MKKILFFWLVVFSLLFPLKAQELNATVLVNYDQVRGSNTNVFIDLEKKIGDFLNGTKWTNDIYSTEEKIECSFRIIVSEVNANNFKAKIQIQSRRPVYGSLYYTPILNLQDDKVEFNYYQNQQILFNIRSFSGDNLPELIAYYVYLILGYDADTFKLKGGTPYFTQADQIADLSFNQGYGGWEQNGTKSRKLIVSNIFNKDLNGLRDIWYIYHRLGLDTMQTNIEAGKENIAKALMNLDNLNINFTNSYNVIDLFLFTKQDEIQQIFSQGGKESYPNINKLKEILTRIYPLKSEIWSKLQ